MTAFQDLADKVDKARINRMPGLGPPELDLPVVSMSDEDGVNVRMVPHLNADSIQCAIVGGANSADDDEAVPLICVQLSYGDAGLFNLMDIERAQGLVDAMQTSINAIKNGEVQGDLSKAFEEFKQESKDG